MSYYPDEHQSYILRRVAADLLKEATTRGDQDHGTVAWVVGYLLRRANEVDQ